MEKRPPVKAITEEVEFPYDCDVNGKTCPAKVEVETVLCIPLEPVKV